MPKSINVMLKAKDKDTLSKKVDNYMMSYHPLGYGTRLSMPVYQDKETNEWVAVINRLDSCD